MMIFFALAFRKNKLFRGNVFLTVAAYMLFALVLYVPMIFLSHGFQRMGWDFSVVSESSAGRSALSKPNYFGEIENNQPSGNFSNYRKYIPASRLRGLGTCETVSLVRCFVTQGNAAFRMRYLSSIAGIWMASQGGFNRGRYPTRSFDFANLMMKKNPWGVNDKYGVTFKEWQKMGRPQSPYIGFAASYGFWILGALLLFFALIWIAGLQNIRGGETITGTVITVFFMVNVAFNHSQEWINSGNWVLILMGFCAFYILGTWISRYRRQAVWGIQLSRQLSG